MHHPSVRLALVLGLLSAVGPFATDMYLPALPAIGRSLGASPGQVQASLMAFFIAMGVGQIVYGPVSDMFGRKAPLYVGLVLFAVGSVGCAMAGDIGTLVAFRFLQGMGACAGVVVPRAVVRDLHTGHEAARLMALLMLVFSVSPILAPLAGSVLTQWLGWRSVFWAIVGLALAGLVLVAFGLKETRPPALRNASSLAGALAAYGVLLRDRHFLGLVMPTTAVLALDRHGNIAGTASALLGTTQFLVGAAVMALVGLFVDGSALPMLTGIGLCAASALVVSWLTLGVRPRRSPGGGHGR